MASWNDDGFREAAESRDRNEGLAYEAFWQRALAKMQDGEVELDEERGEDEDCGYELNDPKHPRYADNVLWAAERLKDQRRGL